MPRDESKGLLIVVFTLLILLLMLVFPFGMVPAHANSQFNKEQTPSPICSASVVYSSQPAKVDYVSVGFEPQSMAYDANNSYLYVANAGNNNITVLDKNNTPVTTLQVGNTPEGLLFDPHNSEMYVANWGSNNVYALNSTSERTVAVISGFHGPDGMVYNPENNLIYVTNNGLNTVSVFSTNTNTIIGNITVGPNPDKIIYDPVNQFMYVTNGYSNTVSYFNSNNVFLGNITVQAKPFGITFDPINGNLYVSDSGTGNVSVINTTSESVMKNISLLKVSSVASPFDIFYLHLDKMVYSSTATGILPLIDPSNGNVVRNISLSGQYFETFAFAFDPSNDLLYVSNGYGYNIAAVNLTLKVTFLEKGLLSGQKWGVELNHTFNYSNSLEVVFTNVLPGSYSYSVLKSNNYAPVNMDGFVNLSINSVSIGVTYKQQTSWTQYILPIGVTVFIASVAGAVIFRIIRK